MSLLSPIKADLSRICQLLNVLDDKLYVQPLTLISGATVGQHVRHILEFYGCILADTQQDLICYDNRKRDPDIETGRIIARAVADRLMDSLEDIMIDRRLHVQANYATEIQDDIFLSSTLFRELAYALDHSIHHQAIIKVGLAEQSDILETIKELGVAPATLRHQSTLNKAIL